MEASLCLASAGRASPKNNGKTYFEWGKMKKTILVAVVGLFAVLFVSLSLFVKPKVSNSIDDAVSIDGIDNIAESYVKLVLEVGLYDPDYVDAYYGPEEWRPAEGSKQKEFPHEQLTEKVNRFIEQLEKVNQNEFSPLEKLRCAYLEKQLLSVKTKINLLSGKRMSFDEESKSLYDSVAPKYDEEYFGKISEEIDEALPGEGELTDRFAKFKNDFIVPKDKLELVFDAALSECRKRSRKYLELPDSENITVEYVTNKSWSADAKYQGNYSSKIRINTDVPIYIDWVLYLAVHEAYPGHHVNYILLEKHLVRDKKWVEYSLLPSQSPRVFIAEGLAEYAMDVIFPKNERLRFAKEVLFPMAGFDPDKAEKYYDILNKYDEFRHRCVWTEVTRQYTSGEMDREKAIKWLIGYYLFTKEYADLYLSFFENIRSGVICYDVARNAIKNHIEDRGGTADNPAKRWELYKKLSSTPQTPSGLTHGN